MLNHYAIFLLQGIFRKIAGKTSWNINYSAAQMQATGIRYARHTDY